MREVPPPFNEALNAATARGLDSSHYSFNKVFTDGLSHNTALVDSNDTQLVIKLFINSPQLRHQAMTGQAIASKLGIAPQIVFADADIGLLVSHYIRSESLAHQVVSSCQLRLIAASLTTLHTLPLERSVASLGTFDMLKFCNKYVSSAGLWGQQEHQRFIPKINQFQKQPHMAFCHNDLVAANIFIEQSRALFIDWEYAQTNNLFFDLAGIVFYLNLSNDQQQEFLTYYFGRTASASELANLRLATAVLLWGDVLWHIDSFGLGYVTKLQRKLHWLHHHDYISQLP